MNHGRKRSRCPAEGAGILRARAFSLIELLVVVAILLLLSTLYWGGLKGSGRQRQLQNNCAANLQKLYVALEIYANDHDGKFPQTNNAHAPQEPLSLLVPRYTADTSAFICPGSKDSRPDPGEPLQRQNISYAYYMGCSITDAQQALLTDKQVDAQPKARGQPVFSTNGKPPANSHGKSGGNVLFCDGRTELIPPQAPYPLPVNPPLVLLNPK